MTGRLSCIEIREDAAGFVLGALDGAEEAAVRAHLRTCPEAHEEFAELGAVLPILAQTVELVEPPAGLKGRILAAAAEDLAARRSATATDHARGTGSPTAIAFPTASERAKRDVRRASRSAPLGWVLRVAAVLAIVGLAGWNVLLQGQLGQARSYERDVAAVLEVAAQTGSLTAILRPDGGSGTGLAAVDRAGNVTLAMRDLAPTRGDQVYTAWVIGGDGTPVPLGSFKVGEGRTAFFVAPRLPTESGITLALTLEPGPGAIEPTLPIISKGEARSA